MYTRQQHITGKNRCTHPQPCTAAVQQYYSSTAVRSTALKPTKRSAHPPLHREEVLVQERTYSSSRYLVDVYIYPRILPMVPLCFEKFYLLLFWSRLVHANAHRLTPFYVPVSPCARSATCKPCPMALVPDSTDHCSRPPAPPTHHDIVKQYRKGTTAVVDRCVYIS